jgi:ribosomal protein S12 methylthiotransferase
VPSIALRTTLIVGFPGEGEREFEELLDFVAQARFDHLGVFGYSWQEENPGAELGDPVPAELKAERRDRVLAAQQAISHALNRALVGRTLPAIVVGPLLEMELLTEGRLQRQAPEIDGRLLINDGTAAAGSLVEVEVTEAHPYDLVGRLVAVTQAATPRAATALPVLG